MDKLKTPGVNVFASSVVHKTRTVNESGGNAGNQQCFSSRTLQFFWPKQFPQTGSDNGELTHF